MYFNIIFITGVPCTSFVEWLPAQAKEYLLCSVRLSNSWPESFSVVLTCLVIPVSRIYSFFYIDQGGLQGEMQSILLEIELVLCTLTCPFVLIE